MSNFQEAKERASAITREVKNLSLTQVMELNFGLGGEKSGAKWVKYWVDGQTLMEVEREGPGFRALNGRQFSCLKGKMGGQNAINLFMAVKEALGQGVGFSEAREQLQRQFLPHTLYENTPKKPSRKIIVGEIDLPQFFHKGAVILDSYWKEHDLVLRAWDESKESGGDVEVIKCDELGNPLPDAKPRTHSTRPRTFLGGMGGQGTGDIIVKSQHPLIPHGTNSEDPNLILVPFGPFSGAMLGELSQAQLEAVKARTTSAGLKAALEGARPWKPEPSPKMAEPPREEPAEEVPIQLPKRIDQTTIDGKQVSLMQIVRDYLTKRRFLPEALVDAAMAQNVAYPAESIIYKKGSDGERRPENGIQFKHPAICFPIAGLKTRAPIAYQLKVIYQDPVLAKRYKGKDSYNFGPVNQGFMMIGDLNEKTRNIVLTEAAIDGLSKWALHRYDEHTCIMATTGTRSPENLIQYCKEHSIELTTALDNDCAGRSMAKKIAERCRELGVKHRDEVVEPAEIGLALKDDEKGRERLHCTEAFCYEHKVVFKTLPVANGWLRLRIDNTHDACDQVFGLQKEDRKDANDRWRANGNKEELNRKSVEVEYFNKDWNDTLKGGYQRSFTTEFERDFRTNRVPSLVDEAKATFAKAVPARPEPKKEPVMPRPEPAPVPEM